MEWGEGGGVQKVFLFLRKGTTTMGQLIILFVELSFRKLNFGSYCTFKGTSFKLLYIIIYLLKNKIKKIGGDLTFLSLNMGFGPWLGQ